MKAFHEVRNYRSDFMVWQCAYTNISFLAHWHQEIELIYLRSGSARFASMNTISLPGQEIWSSLTPVTSTTAIPQR
ncbi:MAG: hypothetical protein ACLR6B_00355 [Blautia sp.]